MLIIMQIMSLCKVRNDFDLFLRLNWGTTDTDSLIEPILHLYFGVQKVLIQYLVPNILHYHKIRDLGTLLWYFGSGSNRVKDFMGLYFCA